MRTDYQYIQKATDILLETTSKGDKWVHEKIETDDKNLGDAMVDMVLALNENYVVLKGDKAKEMKKVFSSFRRQYKQEYGDFPMATFAQFMKALEHGLIGFRIVIWG